MVAKRHLIALLLALPMAGCESDPHRFEHWADRVASIKVSADRSAPSRDAPTAPVLARTAAQAGLRPAMQVQVVEPLELWASRDAGLRGAAEAAAPAMLQAVGDAVTQRAGMAAAKVVEPPATSRAPRAGHAIQIGAFGSRAAAEAAWSVLRTKAGLRELSPRFETVAVANRQLVRLKVGPVSPGQASVVCAAAGVADPWCASTGRS